MSWCMTLFFKVIRLMTFHRFVTLQSHCCGASLVYCWCSGMIPSHCSLFSLDARHAIVQSLVQESMSWHQNDELSPKLCLLRHSLSFIEVTF